MNRSFQGWNGSRAQEKVHSTPKKPPTPRWIYAILIILAFGGLSLWLVLDGNAVGRNSRSENGKKISEMPPSKPSKAAESVPIQIKNALPIPNPSGKRIEKREKVVAPQSLGEMEAVMTNMTTKEERYVPFKNGAEQLIALATPSSPGAAVPPLPMITDEGVAKEVKEAMSHVIASHEKDTEETLERKLVVADAKDEFRELHEKSGWTFTEYVNALRDKANLDSEFLVEANKLCTEIYHNASISDGDYIKYREQINEKLRERGLPEIEKEGNP